MRVFPKPEGMQYDFASKNIVTQAVISPAYAPLSFTELQTGELLYLIASVAVVGMVAENLNQLFECADQGGVFPGDRSEFPLERGRGEDSKRSGDEVLVLRAYFFLRLLLGVFSSARNSCALRAAPRRYSAVLTWTCSFTVRFCISR